MSLPDHWGGSPTEPAPDLDPDNRVSKEVGDEDDEQTITASQQPCASLEPGPGPGDDLSHQSSNVIDFDDGHYHDRTPSGPSDLVSQSSPLDRASLEPDPASDDDLSRQNSNTIGANHSYNRTPFGSALVNVEKQNGALGSANRDLDEASVATSADQLPDYARTGPPPPAYTSHDIALPTPAHSRGSPDHSPPYRPMVRATTGWFTGRFAFRNPREYVMTRAMRSVSTGGGFMRHEPIGDEFMRGEPMRDESESMGDVSTRDESMTAEFIRGEFTRNEFIRGEFTMNESMRDEFMRGVTMGDEHTRGESIPMNDLSPLDQHLGHYPDLHSDQHSDLHSASMADEQLWQWEQTHEEQSIRDEESAQTHRATADAESRYRYDIEANENRWFGVRLYGWFTFGSGSHSFPVERRKIREARRMYLLITIFFVCISLIAGGLISRHDPSHTVTEVWNPIPGITPPELPVGLVAMRPFDGPEKLTTCVGRPYQWSCALPPDTTYPTTTALNDGARVPLFRFAIERRNRTDHSQPASHWGPLPSGVPDAADYLSLANLDAPIDRMGKPKYPEGEETDYYITLIDYTPKYTPPLPRVHPKRDNMRNPSSMIPHTLINQPLRLFDRGLWTEHYAFNMYFDKTIQFSNDTKLPGNTPDLGGVSAVNGRYKIVWHNTRFRVQMFTSERKRPILRTSPDAKEKIKLEYEFERPMEIWEDRAGGEKAGRTVTATIVDENGMILRRVGIPEKRGVGTEDRGCYCRWRNFYDMT